MKTNISNIIFLIEMRGERTFNRYKIYDDLNDWTKAEKDKYRFNGNFYSCLDLPTFGSEAGKSRYMTYEFHLQWCPSVQQKLHRNENEIVDKFIFDAAVFASRLVDWFMDYPVEFDLYGCIACGERFRWWDRKLIYSSKKDELRRIYQKQKNIRGYGWDD